MTTLTIPSYLSEQEVIDLNKDLSKDFLEVCGIKDNDTYIVLGAGLGSCMFTIPDDYQHKPDLTVFHTHPIEAEPSDLDISVVQQLCISMEVFTPNNKYIIISECDQHDM